MLGPIRVPALFRWAQEEESETLDASHVPWQAPELPLDDERILGQELAGKHLLFARQYKTGRNPQRAAAHFESALALGPRAEVYLDYGTMLASYGTLGEARVLLERALALEPNLKQAVDALALVRKLIAEGK